MLHNKHGNEKILEFPHRRYQHYLCRLTHSRYVFVGYAAEPVGVDVSVGDEFFVDGDLTMFHGVELVSGIEEKIKIMGDKHV